MLSKSDERTSDEFVVLHPPTSRATLAWQSPLSGESLIFRVKKLHRFLHKDTDTLSWTQCKSLDRVPVWCKWIGWASWSLRGLMPLVLVRTRMKLVMIKKCCQWWPWGGRVAKMRMRRSGNVVIWDIVALLTGHDLGKDKGMKHYWVKVRIPHLKRSPL